MAVVDRTGVDRRRAVGLALGAALLFGASTPFAKELLAGASPELLAGLLYLGSGCGLAGVLLWRRMRTATPLEAPLTRRDAPWLGGAIASGGVVAPLLLMLGLARTPASVASLLLNLEGALTALIAWFVFRENFDRRIALGMAAIVAGGVVLSGQGGAEWRGLAGPFFIAGACACWAIDNNLTQKVSGGDPVEIAMIKGLVAGGFNVVLAVGLGAGWPSPLTVGGALLLGFVSYGASLVLFLLALRHLGTARTSAYFSVAPFVGALVSFAVWRDSFTPTLLIGGACMVVGVWLHVMERHEHSHTHEELEHSHAHIHDEHHQHVHLATDPSGEPHTHLHRHEHLAHSHVHYPDIHHRHDHI